jgi:outer membrane protein
MIAKISLAISLFLALAVGFLFYKTTKKTISDDQVAPVIEAPAFANADSVRATVMAFVNGDSLTEKYKFIVDKTAALEQKLKNADQSVQKQAAPLEKEWNELMKYANENPNMKQDEAATIQQRMGELQESLKQIQEKEGIEVQKKEAALQKELQDRVGTYLKKFAAARGIDYVMNYQEGTNLLLYGNKGYDITSEVIAGLNQEYMEELAGKK